jgi:hypothetical protein
VRRSFAAGGVLLFAAVASAQSIINPDRLSPRLKNAIEQRDGRSSIKCEVTPIKPALNWGFRFQAGYVTRIPLDQYLGSGHRWAIIVKITPEFGEPRPVYLMSRITLPTIPQTKLKGELGGGYVLGEGRYMVEWTLIDNKDRICRKDWKVEVERGRSERNVAVALPPNTVRDLSFRQRREMKAEKAGVSPMRITLLLHAAPLSPRRSRLRPSDTLMLLGSVSSLLESLPVASARLVVFNLDQQKEIFRRDDFDPRTLDQVAQEMNQMELGSVEYSILENSRGHVQLLSDLVNQELAVKEPSDAVVFIGPLSRYTDKIREINLEKPRDAAPHFFYFQLRPYFRRTANFPDSIHYAVDKVKGKTIVIHSPGEFANAIEQLESRVVGKK